MLECAGCKKEIPLDGDKLADFVGGECIYFHNEDCKKKWEEKGKGKQTVEAKDFLLTVDKASNEIKIEPKVLA